MVKNYYLKYLKYKNKYLKLSNMHMHGGADNDDDNDDDNAQLSNETESVPTDEHMSVYGIIRSIDTENIIIHNLLKYLNNLNYDIPCIKDLDTCITKFITYNTLEHNLASLYTGRSSTTCNNDYNILNNMFTITCVQNKDKCEYRKKGKLDNITLENIFDDLFENYRGGEKKLSNSQKDKMRTMYYTQKISEFNKDLVAELNNIDRKFNSKSPTYLDFMDLLKQLIENNDDTPLTLTSNKHTYTINKTNLANINDFNETFTFIKNANNNLQNKNWRLPLVLGRIIDASTTNSIIAVEELSQCRFDSFTYNNHTGDLLSHLNNKHNNNYCCIINPDIIATDTTFILNDMAYWGGSCLYIPCNYFKDISLGYNTYYVLLDSQMYNINFSAINKFIENNNNFIFNPIFSENLVMSVLSPKNNCAKKSNRTVITIYCKNTHELIISGHFETDSNEPEINNIVTITHKIDLFNQIHDTILMRKKITPNLNFYIIGDFNIDFDFDFESSTNLKLKGQLIFKDNLQYKIMNNNYNDEKFTSYEGVKKIDDNQYNIDKKNIDYLITNTNNLDNIIIPIKNRISFNIIVHTGTDHKFVSFIKINKEQLNIYINNCKSLYNITTNDNINMEILIQYLKTIELYIDNDSTYESFNGTIV